MKARGKGSRRVLAIATAIVIAAVWPKGPVHAADDASATSKQLVGAVVKLDASEVFVDLGTTSGIVVGDLLELWRPITVKHPVTGKLLKDRFRIGALRVVQAGPVMSMTKADGSLLRAVEPGDVVIRPGAIAPAAPVAPPVASISTGKNKAKPASSGSATIVVTPPPPPPLVVVGDDTASTDPDAHALSVLFESLAGTDPATRVDRYRVWATAHPKSRFTPVLLEEARALDALDKGGVVAGNTVGEAGGVETSTKSAITPLSFHPLDGVSTGEPLAVSIEIAGPAVGAVMHVRGALDPSYVPLPMKNDGPGYWSATIPVDRIHPPALLYFIEAVDAQGLAQPIEGNASTPLSAKVVTPPTPTAPSSWESTFAIWTDYADYNRLRGNDYAWQTEGWFGMRFGELGLRALRSGFGVYKGKGGGIDDLDLRGIPARSIGLSYGYLEAEWGLLEMFSLITRAIVGLGQNGVTAPFVVRIDLPHEATLTLRVSRDGSFEEIPPPKPGEIDAKPW